MTHHTSLVITISRQLGCGGAFVGKALARTLDIFYADREIIGEAAREFSMLEKDLESRDEKKMSFWQSFIRSLAVAPDAYVKPRVLPPSDDALFKSESEIIARIARERSAVIIGRCGSYILRDHPNHVSVFLHADRVFRKERLRTLYDLSEDAAEKMIAHSDKERASYHRTVTGQEWTDARRYDLALDTGKLAIDSCVTVILKYLDLRKR